MENASPTAFFRESLPVVPASVFPRGCQAICAEISYLSSSACKSPHIFSCAVSEFTAPAAPCCWCGCSQVTASRGPGKRGLASVTAAGQQGLLQEEAPGVLRGRKWGRNCVFGESSHSTQRRGTGGIRKGRVRRAGLGRRGVFLGFASEEGSPLTALEEHPRVLGPCLLSYCLPCWVAAAWWMSCSHQWPAWRGAGLPRAGGTASEAARRWCCLEHCLREGPWRQRLPSCSVPEPFRKPALHSCPLPGIQLGPGFPTALARSPPLSATWVAEAGPACRLLLLDMELCSQHPAGEQQRR